MKKLVCLVAVCFSLGSATCWADITYGELQHADEMAIGAKELSQDLYLLGLYEGIKATNLAFCMQNQPPLYCKPVDFELNSKDLKSIIKDAHEAYDLNNSIPVSYLLFIGLKQTFPCF